MHSKTTTHASEATLSSEIYPRRSRLETIKEHIHHPMQCLDQRRDAVRGFSPAWFTASMSTGIVAVIIHNFPYDWTPLRFIAKAIAGLNLLLIVAFTVLFLWRL
ncbi:Plasma membrane sulfite pump involved in sulfite metabolism, partial [Coemansia nantahalensis]